MLVLQEVSQEHGKLYINSWTGPIKETLILDIWDAGSTIE